MFSAAVWRNIGDSAFHDLEKCLLYALTANVTSDRRIFGFSRYLVYLINVYNSMLCTLGIIICCLYEPEKDIFNILSYIACFCQGSGIGNCKRNIKYLGKCLSKQRFSYARRSEKQDIALVQGYPVIIGIIHSFIVVVHRYGK